MNITMIGLGKLGLPVAEVMAQHHTVKGYDVDPNIQSQSITVCQSQWLACQDADIVFIAVPTPHAPEYGGNLPTTHLEHRDFDYSHLRSALESVRDSAPATALIVNISTVLPGTLRPMITALDIQDRFCYNPYLIAMGTVRDDFVKPDIVMMGFDDAGTRTAQADQLESFYRTLWLTEPHITRGTWEEAESIKIFHNTYITAKVTIANMIQDVTHRIGHANPSVVAEALRHADRVVGPRYMEPGMGDGGACHPRDNIALSWLADQLNLGYDLFHDIMRIRERQADIIADVLCQQNLPITIVGRSFKAGVPLNDGSASELVGHYCEARDRTVLYDRVADASPHVYLLAHDRDHSDYHFNDGSVIVDMYRRYSTDRADLRVIWYGCGDQPRRMS